MADNQKLWDRVRSRILRIAQHKSTEHMIADAEGLACWVEQQISERDARITELVAQLSALTASAEKAGYALSDDGMCWIGTGGGAEFFQGPPIDITHGEDPGDYLERLRAGEEPGMDHLQQADVLSRVDQVNEKAVASAIIALAHATIAEAELMVEHLRLVAESVELQRQAVEDREQADAALMELATREPPPHIRYGAVILRSGRQWCCELSTARAWGSTPAEACAAFDRLWTTGSAEEQPTSSTEPVDHRELEASE